MCWATTNLAESYERHASSVTGPLSPFFQNIAQALLFTADRGDAPDSKLRTSAYETLNTVVLHAALDVCPIIVQLIPVILEKLQATFQMQATTADQQERQAELQGLLCGSLQARAAPRPLSRRLQAPLRPAANVCPSPCQPVVAFAVHAACGRPQSMQALQLSSP